MPSVNTDSAWATVVNAGDYYAFGSEMPGRAFSSPIVGGQEGAYRYGFNGKEKDSFGDQVYDYGFRIYNPRYGKFLSVDPLTGSYPMLTPYQFASNTPIQAIDENGGYTVYRHYLIAKKALLKVRIDRDIARQIAHYASVYSDHPSTGIQLANIALTWTIEEASGLLYSQKWGPDYSETIQSQSDHLIQSVSIHAMRTWWENISDDEAVDRALFGGTFKDNDGKDVTIMGAYDVVNALKGRGIKSLTEREKIRLGMALHTIQDAVSHKGKRWVQTKIVGKGENEEAASAMGHKNEHPTFAEVILAKGSDKASDLTDLAVEVVNGGSGGHSNKEKKQ